MESVYLDHAATTPMHPDVIAEMTQVMTEVYGNASSTHRVGRKASEKLNQARKIIAESIHANEREIIFNSGGTEGDNMAIIGTAKKRSHLGKHIITTKIEHPAVLNTVAYLEEQGFEITRLDVDSQGKISLEEFDKALRPDTILVSIMMGNNEIGNLLPIKAIGEKLSNHQAYFHTDAVQTFGALDIDVDDLKVDFLSASAHKINGPKGVGFLYVRKDTSVGNLMYGGSQEEKRRPSTENIVGICGMAKAVTLHSSEYKSIQKKRNQVLLQHLVQRLDETDIQYEINGDLKHKLPHILNIHFIGVPSDILLMRMDLAGFAFSIGSACTAGSPDPSHVLMAMHGTSDSAITESIRISLGYGNNLSEIDQFADKLIENIHRLQEK